MKARKIRQIIAQQVFTYESISLRITASIGIAWAAEGFSAQSSDLVKAADAMLYRSKALGRNQVNAMVLKYPIDFANIGSQNLIKLPPEGDMKKVV